MGAVFDLVAQKSKMFQKVRNLGVPPVPEFVHMIYVNDHCRGSRWAFAVCSGGDCSIKLFMIKESVKDMRLDVFLVKEKGVLSRVQARERILAGDVSMNGIVVTKPALNVSEKDTVTISGEGPRFVSRAGLKLQHAFDEWGLDVTGATCVDIGASTGGFTEVLLRHGARKVYAIDVGHDQLHVSLRNDRRVVSREGVHIKDVTPESFDETISCVVIDVSFISLEKVLPKAKEFLRGGGWCIALIKPQFEVGKDNTKKGIVTDDTKRSEAVVKICACAETLGFHIIGVTHSPIRGGDGNKEFLLCARV